MCYLLTDEGQKFYLFRQKQKNVLKHLIKIMETIIKSSKEEVSLNSFKKSSDSGSLLAPVPGKLIKVIFEEG